MLSIAVSFIVSCSNFDDSEIWDKLNDHEKRIEYLEEVCKKLNTDIINIQSIITALETNDYIISASPLVDGTGYTFIFKSGKSIVIYNGKDGVDGKDGTIPTISVMKDVDGIYYWTINGEWLLVNGSKVKASATDGIDGITPQFKIENDYWYISYDNGNSWDIIGKATGSNGLNGTDGDSMFKRVFIEDGYVCFELNDETNTIIRVPLIKDSNLSITTEVEGSLSRILTSEENRTTTTLTITGPINNRDMQHIQIMNNLQKLDLSQATYIDTSYPTFSLNPYQDTLINKSIEEVILPKLEWKADISYCIALKMVTITSDNQRIEHDILVNEDGFKYYNTENITFCPNLKIFEFKEEIKYCDRGRWNNSYHLDKIIYPSTLVNIPLSITLSQEISDTSNSKEWIYTYTIPCDTLICKACIPPTVSEEDIEIFKYKYDTINKYYYKESNRKFIYKVNVPSSTILYVPKESIQLYKSAPLWEIFTNIKALENLE